MNKAPLLICFMACIAAAVYARYLTNLERTPAPYHLMHGPNDGCLECEDK